VILEGLAALQLPWTPSRGRERSSPRSRPVGSRRRTSASSRASAPSSLANGPTANARRANVRADSTGVARAVAVDVDAGLCHQTGAARAWTPGFTVRSSLLLVSMLRLPARMQLVPCATARRSSRR